MMQLVRRQAGGLRHRLDGGLRAPVLGDEGDRAPHRVIVAQCGVEARLDQALVMYGEGHHVG
jgi:hypothetical protein